MFLAQLLLFLCERLTEVMASTSGSALDEILADRELFQSHFRLSHDGEPFGSDESDLDGLSDVDVDSDDYLEDRYDCDGKQELYIYIV